MRTVKNIFLVLVGVISLALSLPAYVVLATGTTTEVNNGNTIILKTGETIAASPTSGIPIEVKNLPNLGSGNGLAVFDFTFTWDKNVIRVDSAYAAAVATGWSLFSSAPDNTTGTLKSVGFTTTYSTADVILIYMGITAVGKVGTSTSISVTITSLGMNNGSNDIIDIPSTPVSAPVRISGANLVSITVTSPNPSVFPGSTSQFTAMGTYDDKSNANITSIVTWTSSNQTVATIDTAGEARPGMATGLAAGITTITASVGTVSSTSTLTVSKAGEDQPVTSSPDQTVVTPTPTSPAATTPPRPGETTPAAPTPTGETKTTNPPPAASTTPINWGLFGGIAAGVVILGLGAYLLLRSRM